MALSARQKILSPGLRFIAWLEAARLIDWYELLLQMMWWR